MAALERMLDGAAYNIADDEPVSFADLLIAMTAAIGAPEPRTLPRWLLTADALRQREHDRWSAGEQCRGETGVGLDVALSDLPVRIAKLAAA